MRCDLIPCLRPPGGHEGFTWHVSIYALEHQGRSGHLLANPLDPSRSDDNGPGRPRFIHHKEGGPQPNKNHQSDGETCTACHRSGNKGSQPYRWDGMTSLGPPPFVVESPLANQMPQTPDRFHEPGGWDGIRQTTRQAQQTRFHVMLYTTERSIHWRQWVIQIDLRCQASEITAGKDHSFRAAIWVTHSGQCRIFSRFSRV